MPGDGWDAVVAGRDDLLRYASSGSAKASAGIRGRPNPPMVSSQRNLNSSHDGTGVPSCSMLRFFIGKGPMSEFITDEQRRAYQRGYSDYERTEGGF
jgi:hypothetical protein